MNEQHIDHLLRRAKPRVEPPPFLEGRIKAALRRQPARRVLPVWAWFAVPVCGMLALLLLVVASGPKAGEANQVAEVNTSEEREVVSDVAEDGPLLTVANPLRSEVRALRNDAERTGRFLLNCMPSVSVAE